MQEGRIITSGTFSEVVANAPAFARQASLAGLVADDTPANPEADTRKSS